MPSQDIPSATAVAKAPRLASESYASQRRESANDEFRVNSKMKPPQCSISVPGLTLLRYTVLAIIPLLAFSQCSVRIAGVQEPPELRDCHEIIYPIHASRGWSV